MYSKCTISDRKAFLLMTRVMFLAQLMRTRLPETTVQFVREAQKKERSVVPVRKKIYPNAKITNEESLLCILQPQAYNIQSGFE